MFNLKKIKNLNILEQNIIPARWTKELYKLHPARSLDNENAVGLSNSTAPVIFFQKIKPPTVRNSKI